MKNLIREAVIIASFGLAYCLSCIAIECSNLYIKLSWDLPEDRRSFYIKQISTNLAKYVGGVLVCILLIWAVKKKRHFAIIPAMLCALSALGFTVFMMGYNLALLPFGHFDHIEAFVPYLGVEVLLFYILATLFGAIRREKFELLKQENPQNPNYYEAI
ncbi:uncharacterized protein LOC101889513 [Musca domestica]|uniref:Uncharacterized protein LOC101889513 n=1 Tax=Musca domestica TaxID=7370 RepID=A0A1I8M1S1_MUSDO|nr:uncharacterized protein LOC101889513 [Musca domestica]